MQFVIHFVFGLINCSRHAREIMLHAKNTFFYKKKIQVSERSWYIHTIELMKYMRQRRLVPHTWELGSKSRCLYQLGSHEQGLQIFVPANSERKLDFITVRRVLIIHIEPVEMPTCTLLLWRRAFARSNAQVGKYAVRILAAALRKSTPRAKM